MTRPDVACLCVHLGIHSAITVAGEHRDQLLAQFAADRVQILFRSLMPESQVALATQQVGADDTAIIVQAWQKRLAP